MKIIGLTGGIAAGKSTVASILKQLHAVVIDADQLARDVVMPGESACLRIREEFGDGVFYADGSLNRAALGALVFADPGSRKRLEEITHPEIRKLATHKIESSRDAGEKFVFYMAPLLFEVGLDAQMDEVWVIYADEQTQLRRLMERDEFSREEALRRVQSQMSMDEKKRRAKVVIDNSGSLEETERQVREAWEKLIKS